MTALVDREVEPNFFVAGRYWAGLSATEPNERCGQQIADFVQSFGGAHLIWMERVHRKRLMLAHDYLGRAR